MKISRNNSASLIALLTLISVAISLIALPLANATFIPNPNFRITQPCNAFINVTPNPVGVGQQASILVWLDRLHPSASGTNPTFPPNSTLPSNRWWGYYIDITRPDNNTDHIIMAYCFDSTSSAYRFYVPDVPGTYKFYFHFDGQNTSSTTWFSACNATAYLTVTEERIPDPINSYPLPTEYWTRTIESQNSFWYTVSSNWYNSIRDRDNGGLNARYQQAGIAPNSPHVMWVNTLTGNFSDYNFATRAMADPLFATQIIMGGRLYYPLPAGLSSTGGGYMVVDLTTGQTIFDYNGLSAPQWGEYYAYENMNEHGIQPVGGFLMKFNASDPTKPLRVNDTRFVNPQIVNTNNTSAFDAWIGYRTVPQSGGWPTVALSNYINITCMDNVTAGAHAIDYAGNHVVGYLYNNNANASAAPYWQVRLFNETLATTATGSGSSTGNATNRLSINANITINNVNVRLQNNSVAVAIFLNSSKIDNTSALLPNYLLCRNGTLPNATSSGQYTYFAIDLENKTDLNGVVHRIGNILWMTNYDAPSGGKTLLQGPVAYYDKVWTMVEKETGTWRAYNATTGVLLWVSTQPQINYSPFGYTESNTANGGTASIAYGKLFTTGRSGMVFCYDLFNGTLLWRYSAPVNFAAPIAYYPLHIGAIADGKIYLGTSVPSANTTLIAGSLIRCLDVNNGTEAKFTIPGWGGNGGFAVSDGYMVYLNYYDLKLYCIGRGPSATTVKVTPDISVQGNEVVVTGTITDVSPGSPIKGSAAISDADMGAWMGYMLMGQPLPTGAKGVQIKLTILDPNNNTFDIATVTSDQNGNFNYQWTPDIPGEYKITASFAGTDSYWPSFATSSTFVDNAPAPVVEPPPEPASMTDTYVFGSAAGIIITLVASAIILAYFARKRP